MNFRCGQAVDSHLVKQHGLEKGSVWAGQKRDDGNLTFDEDLTVAELGNIHLAELEAVEAGRANDGPLLGRFGDIL